MLYAIYCKDKPNHLQTRLDNRPAHVDYLKQFAGQHVCTGPLLSDDGQGMVGSLLVMEFADKTGRRGFRRQRSLCQGRPVPERRHHAVPQSLPASLRGNP